MSQAVYVLGVGVWTPQPEAPRPAAQLLPTRMRGRASLLTAMFAEVTEQAARAAGVAADSLPTVFGSAYGEMGTTSTLLEQLRAPGAQLSPAKFQASVHNTAAGQLSIALKNPSFSTSLAAGHDTLAMSLLEACSWLALHPGRVLLACAEEGATTLLQPGAAYAPLAAAFVLASDPPTAGCAWARLSELGPSELAQRPERAHDNPLAPALELAHAVCSGEHRVLHLNPASALGYAVHVESYRT